MATETTPAASHGKFDAVFTVAEGRRDSWQRIHSLGQAWSAARASGKDAGRLKTELSTILAVLAPVETLFSYPGPLARKLKERLDRDDATGFAEQARRISRAVLGGTYRRERNADVDSTDDNGEATLQSRAPVYARGDGSGAERLYFELL